jgi:aqualysin 1
MPWPARSPWPVARMDDAAKALVDAGLLTVFIAGNFGKGDCQNSPKDSRAITMANSNSDDERHTAGENPSSYGPCVTAFAPGADVTGAHKDSDTATVSGWNGTSFSAPLAAGVVAILLENNPGLTMAAARQFIIDRSTKGALTNVGAGTPNRLLHIRV